MTSVGVRVGQLTVEQAMVATLEKWLPEYVVAAARRYAAEGVFGLTPEAMELMLTGFAELLADPEGDHAGLPYKPRGITVAKSFEDWKVNALPHVQVLSTDWDPSGGGQNGRSSAFQVWVACLVGAQDEDNTRLLRACYEDAITGLVEQHPSLGGLAVGISVKGGGGAQFDEISGADARTFQGSITVFEVEVDDVIDPRDGPLEPLEEGPGVPPVQPGNPVFEGDAEMTLEPEPVGD